MQAHGCHTDCSSHLRQCLHSFSRRTGDWGLDDHPSPILEANKSVDIRASLPLAQPPMTRQSGLPGMSPFGFVRSSPSSEGSRSCRSASCVATPVVHSSTACMPGRPLLALMLDDLIRHPWFLTSLKQPSQSRWMDIASQHDVPGKPDSCLTGPETTPVTAVSPHRSFVAPHNLLTEPNIGTPQDPYEHLNRTVACAYIDP